MLGITNMLKVVLRVRIRAGLSDGYARMVPLLCTSMVLTQALHKAFKRIFIGTLVVFRKYYRGLRWLACSRRLRLHQPAPLCQLRNRMRL